ncbi:MAG: response regulator transcription factor [Chitinophagales bacterium]
MYHILLVEDDLTLGFLLVEYLEAENYKVKLCRDGSSAWKSFQKEIFDLCILDIMLPKIDGFTLAQQIRQENSTIPFLFLTARSLKQDKLRGFSLGAEDFITKPFDEEELLCRLQVILRRKAEGEELQTFPKQFQVGDYFFDYERQELYYKDTVKRITEKENEVLRLLCIHQNKILRREDAVKQIYGEEDYFLGRSFDVFISRIRKLLKKDPRVQIENVFKVGFILNVPS